MVVETVQPSEADPIKRNLSQQSTDPSTDPSTEPVFVEDHDSDDSGTADESDVTGGEDSSDNRNWGSDVSRYMP